VSTSSADIKIENKRRKSSEGSDDDDDIFDKVKLPSKTENAVDEEDDDDKLFIDTKPAEKAVEDSTAINVESKESNKDMELKDSSLSEKDVKDESALLQVAASVSPSKRPPPIPKSLLPSTNPDEARLRGASASQSSTTVEALSGSPSVSQDVPPCATIDTSEKPSTERGGSIDNGEKASSPSKKPPPIPKVFTSSNAAGEEAKTEDAKLSTSPSKNRVPPSIPVLNKDKDIPDASPLCHDKSKDEDSKTSTSPSKIRVPPAIPAISKEKIDEQDDKESKKLPPPIKPSTSSTTTISSTTTSAPSKVARVPPKLGTPVTIGSGGEEKSEKPSSASSIKALQMSLAIDPTKVLGGKPPTVATTTVTAPTGKNFCFS
jgi:hypothetical protein